MSIQERAQVQEPSPSPLRAGEKGMWHFRASPRKETSVSNTKYCPFATCDEEMCKIIALDKIWVIPFYTSKVVDITVGNRTNLERDLNCSSPRGEVT